MIKLPCKQISAPIAMTSPTKEKSVELMSFIQISLVLLQNSYSWTRLRPFSTMPLGALYEKFYFLIRSPIPPPPQVTCFLFHIHRNTNQRLFIDLSPVPLEQGRFDTFSQVMLTFETKLTNFSHTSSARERGTVKILQPFSSAPVVIKAHTAGSR